MSEKLKISTNDELRENLWIDDTIIFEVLENPILATREELDKLKKEIEQISEKDKKTDIINKFIQEKAKISQETEGKLSEMLQEWGIWWIVWWAVWGLQGILQEDDGKKWIEKILSIWEKLTWWWDNVLLGFQSLMWKKFPSIAKMFWIKDPTEKLKQEAEEKSKKLEEKVKKSEEKVRESIKPWFKDYISIYFKIFRTSNEVDDSKLDRKKESSISSLIFEQQYFKDIKYNDLNNSSHIEAIYNAIKPWLIVKWLWGLNDQEIKKYIKIILKSISWWNHISKPPSYKIFSSDKNQKVERWNNFLISMYKKDKQDISQINPSMFDIFNKIHSIWDFVWVLWDESWMDLESIEKWIKWKAQTILSSWVSSIANLSEINFDKIKWWLSSNLQNLWDFKNITTSIFKASDSRTLGNKFQYNWLDDWYNSNEVLKTFAWSENEWLLKFWNDMYDNFFKSQKLLWSTWKISKDQVSLKKVYEIYLITWWKTTIEELSPMQKVNLTANLLASYWSAMDIWTSISDIIDKVTKKDFEMDQDVKNILFSIWKYVLNASIDAATYLWRVWWWMSVEHKIYSIWLLYVLGKAPIFTKRTSLI